MQEKSISNKNNILSTLRKVRKNNIKKWMFADERQIHTHDGNFKYF